MGNQATYGCLKSSRIARICPLYPRRLSAVSMDLCFFSGSPCHPDKDPLLIAVLVLIIPRSRLIILARYIKSDSLLHSSLVPIHVASKRVNLKCCPLYLNRVRELSVDARFISLGLGRYFIMCQSSQVLVHFPFSSISPSSLTATCG